MAITQIPRLLDKYRPLFFGLLLFFSFSVHGQTYSPSVCCTVSNKSYGAAQAVSTDGRSWFYDATNFVQRDYNGTTEVFSYLNLAKYRSGHFPIFVHTGGILQSNGVWLGGSTLVYWFKDSTGNANLVRWYTDSTGVSGGPFYAVANNLSEGNAGLIKGNLALDMVNNTSDAQKNAASVTLTNHNISGLTNTLTNIPNSALVNSSVGLVVTSTPSADISVTTTPASLGNSLIINFPTSSATQRGPLTGADWSNFHIKLDSIHISADSLYNCVNGTCTFQALVGGGGIGTVTNFTAGNLSPLFTTAVATGTSTPALSFAISSAAANSVLGNNTGSTANPGYFVPDNTLLNTWFGATIQPAITLTTTGSSGAATFIGTTLNIPVYSGGGGSGNTNSNIGSGYRWAIPNTNNIKTAFGSLIVFDSTTNTNALTLTADTTAGTQKLATQGFVTRGYQPSGDYITATTGDVAATGPGSVTATIQPNAVTTAKINNAAVTLAKMAPNTANTLLGYDGSGNSTDVTLTTTGTSGAASLGSSVLNIPQYQGAGNYITALTGDVAATGPGSATSTIQPNVVTYSKIQAAAGQGLMGATGAANFGLITLGTNLSMSGTVLNAATPTVPTAGMNVSITTHPFGQNLINALSSLPDRDTVYIVVAGQSNGLCCSSDTVLAHRGDTVTDPNVQIYDWSVNQWTIASVGKSPLTECGLTISGSLGVYVGKILDSLYGKKVKIVVTNKASQAIAQWFNGTTRGPQLDTVINRTTRSGIPIVDLFIWDQGEQDEGNDYLTYFTALDSIKATLRRQVWFPGSTPIVYVGMPLIGQGSIAGVQKMDTVLRGAEHDNDLYTEFAPTDSAMVFGNPNPNEHFNNIGLKTNAYSVMKAYSRIIQPYRPPATYTYGTNFIATSNDSTVGGTNQQYALVGQNRNITGSTGNRYIANTGNHAGGFILNNASTSNTYLANEATLYVEGTNLNINRQGAKAMRFDGDNWSYLDMIIDGPAGGGSTFLEMQNNNSSIDLFGSQAVRGGNAADIYEYIFGAHNRDWYTNNIARLRISSAGNLIIGTNLTDNGIYGMCINNSGGLQIAPGTVITANQGTKGIRFGGLPGKFIDNSTLVNGTVAHTAVNALPRDTLSSNTNNNIDKIISTFYIAGTPILGNISDSVATSLYIASGKSIFGDTVQIKDGTQGANKVLTSDANGNASWQTSGTGITSVGSFSGSSQTNGASISGSTITFGPADGTNPGMVTTGSQTLAGTKTFSAKPVFPTATTSAASINIGVGSASPSSPVTGDIWYNLSAPGMFFQPNGSTAPINLLPNSVETNSTSLALDNTNSNFLFFGSSAASWTLPAGLTYQTVKYTIKNRGTAAITLTRTSTDVIYLNSVSVTSITINPGDMATVFSTGGGDWGASITSSNAISGSFSGVGTATTTFTVTIGITEANSTYKVNVTPTSALSAALFYVNNKTATSFDVVYLAGLTGTVSFDWSLTP